MRTPVRFAFALAAAALLRADDYARQPAIDAQHYIFRITLSGSSEEISGEATAQLRFVTAGVTRFWLDLATPAAGKGMTVTAVTCEDEPVSFTHAASRLTITLDRAPAAGDTRACTVRYHGVPANGLHFAKNRFGDRTVFSWNWATFAHEWLPVIDHPSDKATSEFLITAPQRYQVVANGRLVETRDAGDGRRLTHWSESVPVAAWLNNIGAAEFAVRHFDSVRGTPLETWVFPHDRENGITTFEEPMRQAIEFFSEFIGPYPYEKLAAVEVNGLGGAMEHASEVFYGDREVAARPAFSLVAHEVSHQWWGDSVTESDWDDAWLSEGFATYFSALAQEHYQGREAFLESMAKARAAIFEMEKRRAVPVIHANLPEIRDGHAPIGLVYQKGAWTLHMLRAQVGDTAFRDGLREYYRRFRDGNASTADLQRTMEHATGQELGWLFDQWLRRGGSPVVEGTWTWDAAAKKLRVELAQTQAGDPYRLPLELRIAHGATLTALLTARTQQFAFDCESEPADVIADPRTQLLAAIQLRHR